MTTSHSPANLIILLVLFMLISCGPRPSTLLQDTTCFPPCWNSIVPGQTTKQDVLKILPTLAEVDVDSIKDADVLTAGINDNIYWLFTSKAGDYGGRIYFQDEIVSVISIGPKTGVLTFGEAIQKLGDPEQILAYTDIGDGPRLIVYLLYPTKGYALLMYNNQFSSKQTVTLDKNQSVMQAFYFRPEIFNEIMTSGPVDSLDPTFLSTSMQPWKGFGEISISRR